MTYEEEDLLPSTEDFIPVLERPTCPICGEDMIHTRLEISNDVIFHCWLCDCEIQPEDFESLIRKVRAGAEGESLVIRGE